MLTLFPVAQGALKQVAANSLGRLLFSRPPTTHSTARCSILIPHSSGLIASFRTAFQEASVSLAHPITNKHARVRTWRLHRKYSLTHTGVETLQTSVPGAKPHCFGEQPVTIHSCTNSEKLSEPSLAHPALIMQSRYSLPGSGSRHRHPPAARGSFKAERHQTSNTHRTRRPDAPSLGRFKPDNLHPEL